MSTPDEWAKAYARQAAADFQTYLDFQGNGRVPQCHKLQFLQMACEKLAKAHLCKHGTDPKKLQSSHAYIAGTVPIVLRFQLDITLIGAHNSAWIMQHTRLLAQEIEMLAPAVKRGGTRPDNCEYPWADSKGDVVVPLDWTFKPSGLLLAKSGPTFLKLVLEAIKRLQ